MHNVDPCPPISFPLQLPIPIPLSDHPISIVPPPKPSRTQFLIGHVREPRLLRGKSGGRMRINRKLNVGCASWGWRCRWWRACPWACPWTRVMVVVVHMHMMMVRVGMDVAAWMLMLMRMWEGMEPMRVRRMLMRNCVMRVRMGVKW